MITYVHDRLLEWALWSHMRVDGWYGFSGQFGYDEPMPMQPRALQKMQSSDRCIETEEGVAWLGKEFFTLGAAVICHYRDHPGWSADIQAEFLHCGRRTLFWRIHRGQSLLLEYFIDRAAGIVPQTEQLRSIEARLELQLDNCECY